MDIFVNKSLIHINFCEKYYIKGKRKYKKIIIRDGESNYFIFLNTFYLLIIKVSIW